MVEHVLALAMSLESFGNQPISGGVSVRFGAGAVGSGDTSGIASRAEAAWLCVAESDAYVVVAIHVGSSTYTVR